MRLLSTLAASLGVALENARLFAETRRLLDETQQRAAELAVINTVQQGLAAQLDTQAIYDLVGEKLRSIFDAQVFTITSYDRDQHLAELRFGVEDGQRVYDVPYRYSETAERLIATRQPILVNFDPAAPGAGHPPVIAPGTRAPRSALFVPLVLGDQVMGAVSLQNLDRYDAFGDSEVRLLTTLAASMGVALENARLFDETKRCSRRPSSSAAELAVINSVQQGLAAELDFQGIIDLVGDKLREVLRHRRHRHPLYDAQPTGCHYVYEFEHGERLRLSPAEPRRRSPSCVLVTTARQPLMLRRDARSESRCGGMPMRARHRPGASRLLAVPIIARRPSSSALIGLENYEREHAFGDSDVRLLTRSPPA